MAEEKPGVMPTLREETLRVLVEECGISAENAATISDSTELQGGVINLDSLTTVELMMAYEEQLQVVVPDDELPKLKTFGDLVAAIEKTHAANVS